MKIYIDTITQDQLARLSRVTGITEDRIVLGQFSRQKAKVLPIACKFIKVGNYEESRYRKRTKVC